MPAGIPTGQSGATDQPAFFSNTGEIAFKPSVRIYCGSEVGGSAEVPNTSTNTVTKQGVITTSYIPTNGVVDSPHATESQHPDPKSLTIAENAKRLAKMCVQARTQMTPDAEPHTSTRYGSPYESRLSAVREHEFEPAAPAAPAFERLVQQFVREGQPAFNKWRAMDPKRKLQSKAASRAMYEQIRTANLWDRMFGRATPTQDCENLKKLQDRAIDHDAKVQHAKVEQIKHDRHAQNAQKNCSLPQNAYSPPPPHHQYNTSYAHHDPHTHRRVTPSGDGFTHHFVGAKNVQDWNVEDRLQNLETHVGEISTGVLQNNKELERKFKHVDTHIAASKQMGTAILANNKTIATKFKHVNEVQAAQAETLGAHDQGLRNHHDTLQRMGSDLRMQGPAPTQGAVTLAPSAPQKKLSINELNAMACNF